jgi:hypothetical protein
MAATPELAAILRDAAKRPLLRMRLGCEPVSILESIR